MSASISTVRLSTNKVLDQVEDKWAVPSPLRIEVVGLGELGTGKERK